MKRILALFAFLLCYSVYSQIVSVPTLYATEDARTYSYATGTNYGSSATFVVGQDALGVSRGFVKFNLSSLPLNAVITSAILKLTPYALDNSGSGDFYLDVCNTPWTEMGINHASNISNNTFFPTITTSSFADGKREFQIKDYVQAVAEGRLPNTGWRIRRANETNGVSLAFHSRENSTESNRPQLEIKYYIRSSVSAATIVHTSALTTTDGSVSPTVVNGSDVLKTFRWYDAAGAQVGTSQDLKNVGSGWYGLKYYGTVAGDTTYQAFIVGTECEDVSITFSPGPNYIDDAPINNLVRGLGTTTAFFHNYHNVGTHANFVTEKWTNNNVWYDARSLMRFRLWVDPNSQVNSALLTLTGNGHYPLNRSNESEFNLITSNWTETGVAFSNMPTYTSTGKVLIAGIPSGNNNLTTDISGFFNTWKMNNQNNNGMIIQLQSFVSSYTRMLFHSSDAVVAANRPKVVFSIKVNTCDLKRKGTITITENDPMLKKNVQVSLKVPSWAVAPYRYVISELPIPEPANMLKYLNDSVFNPDIDSVSFYRGTTSATSNDFGDVDYSNYYIAAFDSRGKRIFDDNLDVFPALELLKSSNLTSQGYELNGSAASSLGEISAFVNSSVPDCSVKFNMKSTNGDQYYGFLDVSKTLTAPNNIVYGFHIKDGILKTIVNAKESTVSYSVGIDKDITISFLNDSIILSNDSIVFDKAKLTSGYSLKVGVIMNASAKTLVKLRKIIKKPFYLFQTNILTNSRTCASPNSDLSFRVVGFFTAQFGSYTYKFSNKENGLVLAMNTSASNNTTYTIPNLAPGVYSLTCTQNSGATPIVISNIIYVGIQTEWFSTHPNYNLAPNSYSVARDNLAQGTYSKALSTNILPAANAGWAWFNPVCANTTSFFMPNVFSVVDNYSNLLPDPSQIYLNFRRTGNTPVLGIPPNRIILFWGDKLPNGTNVTGAVLLPLDPFVSLQFDPIQMKIYVRSGASAITLTQPAGNIRLKANSTLATEGFKNVYSTFSCGINQKLSEVSHYELARDYTAGYATAVEGKLKFTFDEEYAIAANKKLQYVVYDDANIAIASGSLNGSVTGGATALTYDFDDNRYLLTVSSFATPGKFYHLEVTTSTGQKRYLRFLYKN